MCISNDPVLFVKQTNKENTTGINLKQNRMSKIMGSQSCDGMKSSSENEIRELQPGTPAKMTPGHIILRGKTAQEEYTLYVPVIW